MKSTSTFSRLAAVLPRRILAGSVAALCALAASATAAENTFTKATIFPVWDSFAFGANWSTFLPPVNDTAIFPATGIPGPLDALTGARQDGTEVFLINLVPGIFPPVTAENLIFQGSWKLTQLPGPMPLFLFAPSPLYLTGGNVSVVPGSTAIIEADIFLPNGTLTKKGDGTLIIGDGSYAASRTVYGDVNNEAGTLGGNFNVTGNLLNNATLSPGNSAGEIKVYRNFRQTDDGTLRIELASSEVYDRVSVDGEADLDGDLDVVLLNGYRPKKGQKFDILSADGGVDGEFDDVDAPVWKNLTLRAFYDEHRVYLKTVIHSFAAEAETPNQYAVAETLDEVIYDRRAEKLIHHLYKKDFDELPEAFDEIAPEELSSIFTISTALAVVQNTNLQRRTDDLRAGSGGFSASGLAMQGSGPGYSGSLWGVAGPSGYDGKDVKESKDVIVPDEKKWGVFLTGVGEWVDVDGDGNARGYDLATGGFTLGLDYKVCPGFAFGVAAGYAGTGADLTNDGRVFVNGGKLGLYATFFQANAGGAAGATGKEYKEPAPAPAPSGMWYVDLAVNGGYNSYDTKRSVLGGTARGDTEGGELNVLVGAGYDWKVGALTIGPTATFQYSLVGMDGFTERGSLAPLAIEDRNHESVRTTLGAKASADLRAGGVIIRPEVRAAWQHEFGDETYDITSSFANGAGGTFLVSGPAVGRDSLLVGAGVAVLFSETFSTYVYYDGELFRDNYDRHGVSGGFRIAF